MKIGSSVFSYCDKLSDVKLSGKLKLIEPIAFADIAGSGTITFYGSEADWKKVDVQDESDYLANAKMIFDTSHAEPDPQPGAALKGDVNGDGIVSVTDAVLMQKWIHAAKVMMKNPEAGDMNDDGTVDVLTLHF